MRLSKSIVRTTFIFTTLLLCLQACDKDKPVTPREEVEEVVPNPNRNFVIFDRGIISVTTVKDEASSIAPMIYHFDEMNHFTVDLLKKRNPYAKWGYIGSLHLSADKKYLFLCSSQERIAPRNNAEDPSFNPEGRLSVLNAQTLQLVSQIDFPAFYREDVNFPSELFAFDDKTIYLHYSESKRTVKIDLTLPKEQMTQIEVTKLNNRMLDQVHLYQGRAYMIDKTTPGAYRLLCFNPKDESVTQIDRVGILSRIINAEGDLLYLGYSDSTLGIYSLSRQEFELSPTSFDASMGAVYGAAWDRKSDMLYLSFNDEHVRPFIHQIARSEAKSGASAGVKPSKFAKLELLTSDTSSGRTRLYVDPHQQRLFAVYFHSDRYNRGGMVAHFDLSNSKEPAIATATHQIGRLMSDPIVAFSIPKTDN